jgi:anthranilate phosphoribosyltransferase
MSWIRAVKALASSGPEARELTQREAQQLFAAVFDGGVDALELGAVLTLLEVRGVTLGQLIGAHGALRERRYRLALRPAPPRPVVLSSSCGTHDEPNLLPVLALMLQRLGVTVLMHGALNGGGRTTAAYVLRELGVMPCAHLAQVQERLDEQKFAFAPTAILAPALAELLALKGRLGFDRVAQLLARLLDPFDGEALLVVAARSDERGLLREFLKAGACDALLLEGTEGEAFAHPRRRPRLEHIRGGSAQVLFEAETGPIKNLPALPVGGDADGTARWIRRVLDGEAPLPLPLVNQIACCLYGAGYTEDLNQAKAIAAVETGSLAPA